MRLPNAWDDTSLLEDEPFRSNFVVCSLGNTSRSKGLDVSRRMSELSSELEKEEGGIQAVQTWIGFVFIRDPEIEKPVNTSELCSVFVDFYWKLYQNKDTAMHFLEQQCIRRGYRFDPMTRKLGYVGPASSATQLEMDPRSYETRISTPSQRAPMSTKERTDRGHSRKRSFKKTQNTATPSHSSSVLSSKLSKPLKRREPKTSRHLKHGEARRANVSPRNPDQGKVPAASPSVLESSPVRSSNPTTTHKHPPIDPQKGGVSESLQLDKHLGQGGCSPLFISDTPAVVSAGLPSLHPAAHGPFATKYMYASQLGVSTGPGVENILELVERGDTGVSWDPDQTREETEGVSQCKPPLQMFPPIWAQSRQEVCESLDWFRSYQSGVYHTRNVVKGYLLSAFSSCRDIFEHGGRLIISHGGGKAESLHSHRGQTTTQLAEDQLAQDKSVRALLANYKEQRPLVLLIDDKYTLFPYDLGAKNVTYAVLGFYTIAHAWAEYQPAHNEPGRVVRYKFAFQWCNGQGDPWWITRNGHQKVAEMDSPMSHLGSPTSLTAGQSPVKISEYSLSDLRPPKPDNLYFTCDQCQKKSPQVYRQAWVCLNATCAKFWMSRNGFQLPLQLDYNPSFLRLLPPFLLSSDFKEVRPLPSSSTNGIITTYAFSRGWHCRKCGRLSCRFKWEHWECAYCQVTFKIPGKFHIPKDFWAQAVPKCFRDHFIVESSGITQSPAEVFSLGRGLGQTQTFNLPSGRGQIHHIQAVAPIGNSDADVIFKEYQEQASAGQLAFRRWPLRSHKCTFFNSYYPIFATLIQHLGRGPLLTNYFSQNCGEPYQYVGGTANTIPFSRAPSAVVKARDLIRTRVTQALKRPSEFNEVLSAAYMERQKMAFHSDGERGLGPLVAGLSLGSPALMHFRLHSKYQPDEDRRRLAITFVLRHGDILVMDGAGVQEYYEHTVVPTNFRIAATARWIDPTQL